MDRNTVIGLVLIFLIMIGFGYLTQPSKEEREAYQRKADSIARVQEEEHQKRLAEEQAKALLSDSAKKQETIAQFGLFSDAASGTNKFITLENDL
ncbi:MAG: membrane protein insertase YidC, partial [Bacteroidales bacterium]|nr:membrane protein insertase YidC [Bacteroidales bacterium]